MERSTVRCTNLFTAADVEEKTMTEREILQKKIGTYKFACKDITLFLDTHPFDEESLKKLREYQEKLKPLVKEYEEKFGPLTLSGDDGNTWAWVKDPWPWDIWEEN